MKSTNIPNSASMYGRMELYSGGTTEQACNNMTHLAALKHIFNFFTPGAVSQMNAKHYDAFAQAMTAALVQQENSGTHPYTIPERSVVDFLGYTVVLTQPGEYHNADGPVTIEISKGTETITAEVDKEVFRHISTALLLRHKGGLPPCFIDLANKNFMLLQDANFYQTNLSGLDLSHADLKGADLCDAFMKWANLKEADLNGANLVEAAMINASLSGASLEGANLFSAKLSKADLAFAKLSKADLSWADLSGADLSRADLSGANLIGANLSGANLSGADLSNMSQEDGLLKLQFPTWNRDSLDLNLNHINHPDSGSLLTMMDSIDEQHTDIKLRMAHELMTSLQISGVNLFSVTLPLMDILSKAPYTGDSEVNAWLNTLGEQYLSHYNGQVLPENASVLTRSIDLFTRQPEQMLSHNGAFIQIIAQGMAEQSTPQMKEKAAALYGIYLDLPQIKPYCETPFFGDYHQKPDWEDAGAVNYILIPAGDARELPRPGAVSAMLLSQDSLTSMLQAEHGSAWDNFYLYRDPDHCLTQKEHPAPRALFAHQFPLFSTPYEFIQNEVKFGLMIKSLGLGSLQAAFISATEAKLSTTKLVSMADQNTLNDIFSRKLTISAEGRREGLTEAHYGEIINAYDLASASDADKAEMLLCLAALFTKYSSSNIFGTEHDSPYGLRFYAYALMKKAHTLDSNLVDTATFTDWKNRLLGQKEVFTCSAVLSDMMIEEIRARFPTVLSSVMPPAWS